MQEDFDFNRHIASVRYLLQTEKDAGRRINGLEEIERRRGRQIDLRQVWDQVTEQIKAIQNRIDGLTRVPDQTQIDWAQSVQAMASLRFLEIDTTGTGSEDEIVRVSLANREGDMIFDQFVKPERAHISQQASHRNCLTDADIENAPMLTEIWSSIQDVFRGSYIIAFNLDFDTKVLLEAAKRYDLPALVLVGECLQRRSTAYYMREYYLDIAKVAGRMGHALESWNTPARLKAQHAILHGIASGITDLTPPAPEPVPALAPTRSNDSFLSDGDGLGDLDDHPF